MRFLAFGFFGLLVALSFASKNAHAMDCTLAREPADVTWKASCGIQRAGPHWTGYIQGPLGGSRLTFGGKKKKTVEGATLAPLALLSEIPSCVGERADTVRVCALIAKKIALALPFELTAYVQDPIAFTIGSAWDEKSNTIARGSELTIAACGVGPEKKPDESAPLLYFKKTMQCRWNAPMADTLVPDFNPTLAINCKAPTTGGVLEVASGTIRCENSPKTASVNPDLKMTPGPDASPDPAALPEPVVVSDPIPVVCIPSKGANNTAGSTDPITCLGDDRIGFTTQAELREKLKAPRPAKSPPASKGAAGINGT